MRATAPAYATPASTNPAAEARPRDRRYGEVVVMAQVSVAQLVERSADPARVRAALERWRDDPA